ncbi:MAG: hypothetical protein L0216_20295 [Planctomycetales bacterium]|nr:hypothetical protein [Planctomycetales bacterium]
MDRGPEPAPRPRSPTGAAREGVIGELGHHLPYSVFGVLLALVLVGALDGLGLLTAARNEALFHLLHPAHLLLSATATTAMVGLYGGRPAWAVLWGLLGSAPVCTMSDILIPYVGGLAIGQDMHIHVCLLEEPVLITPFVALGVATGLVAPRFVDRTTRYSHGAHVFVSALASLLYLVSFGFTLSALTVGPVLLLLVVAVMGPCCVSDIVIPVAVVHAPAEERHRH